MKRFLFAFLCLSISASVFSQTKMFITTTDGTDSLWLKDIKSITFKSYYVLSIPNDSLVAWFPFNGTLNDSSGHHSNGTLTDGVTFGEGHSSNSGKSIVFNGSTGFVTIPNSTKLQSMSKSLTISYWINIEEWTKSSYAPVFAKSNSADQGMYSVENMKAGTSNLWIGNSYYNFSTSSISLKQWNHFCFTWDGAVVTYYLNGVIINSAPFVKSIVVDDLPLVIGKHTPGGIEFLNGKIDDLILYSRAINDSEVLKLFNLGK
ncbi:MAG: LamG domain-containing protein [Bacteroidetes bacterium]|nr:LamG domain-containing protein [Bacteroidota bacterium]